MDRYSKVINKNLREIVLLKALPCIWGKCAFVITLMIMMII